MPDDEPASRGGMSSSGSTERYSEMRKHLLLYGTLVLERPSGTFRRITPPSGLNRLDRDEMLKAEDEARTARDRRLFSAIPEANCFIAPIDSVGDTLVRAVDLTLAYRIPVLLLQRQVPIQSEARDRFRQYPNLTYAVFPTDEVDIDVLTTLRPTAVTYVVYRTTTQMKIVITRFMNRVPNTAAHTG